MRIFGSGTPRLNRDFGYGLKERTSAILIKGGNSRDLNGTLRNQSLSKSRQNQ